jgi:hypothetical protein
LNTRRWSPPPQPSAAHPPPSPSTPLTGPHHEPAPPPSRTPRCRAVPSHLCSLGCPPCAEARPRHALPELVARGEGLPCARPPSAPRRPPSARRGCSLCSAS